MVETNVWKNFMFIDVKNLYKNKNQANIHTSKVTVSLFFILISSVFACFIPILLYILKFKGKVGVATPIFIPPNDPPMMNHNIQERHLYLRLVTCHVFITEAPDGILYINFPIITNRMHVFHFKGYLYAKWKIMSLRCNISLKHNNCWM